MSYIEIQGLTKSFKHNVVLDHIDLTIHKGEVTALIGPSGTGKSTFLRCLNRLEKPENGIIDIDGQTFDLATSSTKKTLALRQQSEMVFQQFNLFRQKNALQNIMEGLISVKKYSKKEAQQIAKEALQKVELSAWAEHYPQHLSGGQKQRVAIARALVMEPKLLLLDEPTSALDPEMVMEVLRIIRKAVQAGNTVLMVTHEMNFVRQIANNVVFLENGKIVEQGTPRQIFEQPSSERLKNFLSQIYEYNQIEYTI